MLRNGCYETELYIIWHSMTVAINAIFLFVASQFTLSFQIHYRFVITT